MRWWGGEGADGGAGRRPRGERMFRRSGYRFADKKHAPPNDSRACPGSIRTGHALALPRAILYKPGFPSARARRRPSKSKRPGAETMAVPKRKTSPSRRGMRRSADALKAPTYVEDKDSGELRRPHNIDLKTGMYRGRQVLKVKKEA